MASFPLPELATGSTLGRCLPKKGLRAHAFRQGNMEMKSPTFRRFILDFALEIFLMAGLAF